MVVEEAAGALEPPVELAPGRGLGGLEAVHRGAALRQRLGDRACDPRDQLVGEPRAERRIARRSGGHKRGARGRSRWRRSTGRARGRAADRRRAGRPPPRPARIVRQQQAQAGHVGAVGADAGAAGVEIEELAGADGDRAAVDLVALVAFEHELERGRRRADRRAARACSRHSTSLPPGMGPRGAVQLAVHDGEIAAHFRPVS